MEKKARNVSRGEHDIILVINLEKPPELVENMQEVSGKEPFEERVGIVLDELSLGIRWERPSLILAVYRSEIIKNEVQSKLVRSLRTSGQAVFQYFVDKTHYDIPTDLKDHPDHKRAVYFMCGLRWGGGRGYSNAFRALNMHREYLIDGNIRAIFWLTQKEAKQCSRFAPDFWAFRHKVVEFFELPSPKNQLMHKSSNDLIQNLYARKGTDFQLRMAAADSLFAAGCIEEAILIYRRTLRKYPDQTPINLQIADIYLSLGNIPAAKRILSKESRGRMTGRNYVKELTRLRNVAKSIPPYNGGISEMIF